MCRSLRANFPASLAPPPEVPRWLSESACNAGDLDSIPGPGRSPGEGKGCPLQYSCLENPMDRGAWRALIHGVARRLSKYPFYLGTEDMSTRPTGSGLCFQVSLHHLLQASLSCLASLVSVQPLSRSYW